MYINFTHYSIVDQPNVVVRIGVIICLIYFMLATRCGGNVPSSGHCHIIPVGAVSMWVGNIFGSLPAVFIGPAGGKVSGQPLLVLIRKLLGQVKS